MRKCFTIRLSENIYKKSQKVAFEKDVSMNRIITKCLEEYLIREINSKSRTEEKNKRISM